jgi:PAS domain S-box-containing protein
MKRNINIDQRNLLERLLISEEKAGIGHWDFDVETKAVNWSPNLYKIFEISVNEAPPSIQEHSKYIVIEDFEKFQHTIENAIKCQLPYEVNFKIKTKSGKIKHIEGSGYPSFDDQENIIGFFGIAQDVTSRFEKDELSLFRTDLLKKTEEITNTGHWHINTHGDNTLFWSDEVYRIHGVHKDKFDLTVESAIAFYHPSDRDYVESVVSDAIENGKDFTFELRIIRQDGSIRHVKSYGEVEINEDGHVYAIFGTFSDITDIVQAYNKLKKSNQFLQTLIENIPDFVFVKDNDYKIVQANSAFLEMYPENIRDSVIGTTTLEKYPPEQVALFTANDRVALDTGYHEAVETVNFPSGEQKTLFTKKVGYKDSEGHKHLLGISRDMTDLLATQNLLNAVLDVNTDGLVTINSSGKIENYNQSCKRIFGYTKEEMIGENVKKLMPSFTAKKHDGYLEAYNQTGEKSIIGKGREVIGQHKDGKPIPLQLNVDEFEVNEQKYYAGVLRDLSETKKIQKALADSEYTREAYADASSDGHWDWFLKEDYEYMSPRFWTMMGYDPATKKHHPDSWRELIFPEDLETALRNFDRYIETKGKFPFIQEARYKKADGSTLYVICKGEVVEWHDDNTPIRMIGTHTDITELRKATEELVRSNMEFERFAFVASHDLQEPLRMINNFTGLLSEEYRDQLDKQAQDYIEYTTDAASRMQNLIQDLLEYSRIGNEEVGMREIDCNKKLRIILDNLQKSIVGKNAIITADELPNVYASPMRFTRVFQNLMSNAIKYMDASRIPNIHIGYSEDENNHIFSVKDNGIGIRPEYHDKIFNVFERLHGRSAYEGTGIGLAICRKIVSSMRGQIWLESEEGVGSIFYFSVPKQKV